MGVIEKYKWFRDQINTEGDFGCLDHFSLSVLTSKYLTRFDEIQHHITNTIPTMHKDLKRKPTATVNKYSSKKNLFDTALTIETNHFNGQGLKVPDLTSKSGIESLLAWDGRENGLPSVKVVACKRSWGENEGECKEQESG